MVKEWSYLGRASQQRAAGASGRSEAVELPAEMAEVVEMAEVLLQRLRRISLSR